MKLRQLLTIFALAGILAACSPLCYADRTSRKPLRASEVLALIAGGALPDNTAREIALDGLAFRPDDSYLALLETMDADRKVLAAVEAATITVDRTADEESGEDLLQHLANAASLMNAQRDDEAADELKAALSDSFQGTDCVFVVGELLRREEEWEGAETAYQQIMQEEPDFPEVHTKLSYVLYRDGDDEAALGQAREALKITPNNAEAHRDAGLALADMKMFHAAAEEFKTALRLKPDYQTARADLGTAFANQKQGAETR